MDLFFALTVWDDWKRKLHLSRTKMAARLRLANLHLDEWRVNVLWTDETKVEILDQGGQIHGGDDLGFYLESWQRCVQSSFSLSFLLRPNSYIQPASQSYHRSHREPSPEEEPEEEPEEDPEEDQSYMEEEEEEEVEERGYHTNYSPSPPQQQQYSPLQQGGYESEEYEPEPEPSPPPPPPPRKEIRHSKPSKEPGKNHHHGDRNREEELWQRSAHTSGDRGGKKRSADRERPKSPVQKKHSKKSSSHESKKEEKKKGGDEGESDDQNFALTIGSDLRT